MKPKNRTNEAIEEADLKNDEDYLFLRKADQYMIIVLDLTAKKYNLIEDPAKGPTTGIHWGEVRINREGMFIVGFKLMTLEDTPNRLNPYSESILNAISKDLVEKFPDLYLMACELK